MAQSRQKKKMETCPECGKSFVKLATHITKSHRKAGAELVPVGAPSPRVSKRARMQAMDDQLTMIQFVFPKGIPTNDKARLARALAWVEETGELLLERG